MSVKSHSLVYEGPMAYRGIPGLMFWITVFSLLPLAALFGGMAILIMILAVAMAVFVWARPHEAVTTGMLYLFACSVVLPSSARMDGLGNDNSEMSYWAVGLLIITAAAVARIGLRRVVAVPLSVKVFLTVAFASAVYGEMHGAAMSYVLRQLYGVLLLIVYFGIAFHAGNEELLLRRIRTIGVVCAFCFFVYYVAVFGEYGFHKEMNVSGSQACLLAIILFITGAERKRPLWVLGGIALSLLPVLVFQRSGVLTFLVSLPTALAMKLRSKKLRLLCWSAAVLVALPALYPPLAQTVIDTISRISVIERNLPSGTVDAQTLYERGLQLEAATSTVRAHPWLGEGLGSAFEWDSPTLGFLRGAYVDSGWGYLLQKMGLLGAATFLWFLITVLRGVSRQSVALSACLLSVTFVGCFSQPVFFHFTTAPFIGTITGMLCANRWNLPAVTIAKPQI